MNSTSNRLYLDYNATSPFSKSVLQFLKEGDFLFGNPSSLHFTGKLANRYMKETKEFLFNLFQLDINHKLIFHSGATEGINFFFRSLILEMFKSGHRPVFLFSAVDHSAAYNQKIILEELGFPVFYFSVDKNGQFCEQEILDLIAKHGDKDAPYPAVINYLFVNNETGVTWPLEAAQRIKKSSGALVHVDAVQSVGKISGWQNILSSLDAFTYSAHKFGALKGVGFSFIRHDLSLSPFLYGGQQQEGLRAGTENVLGIYSIKLALEDLLKNEDFASARQKKRQLECALKNINPNLSLVTNEQNDSSTNTLVAIISKSDANTVLTAFDLSGIDVSSGSACSSGLSTPNRILENMGYTKTIAKSAIRLSWDPFLYSEKEWEIVITKVEKVLRRFV